MNSLHYKIKSIVLDYLNYTNIQSIINYFKNNKPLFVENDEIYVRYFLDGSIIKCKIVDVLSSGYNVIALDGFLKNNNVFKIKKHNILSYVENNTKYSNEITVNNINDKVLNDLIVDINSVDFINFKTDENYKKTVCEELVEILNDQLLKDKSSRYIKENENIEVLNIDMSKHNINELLIGLKQSNEMVEILSKYFKTTKDFVDYIDNLKHLYKVSDLTSDIFNSDRAYFNVAVYDEDDMVIIQKNINNIFLSELYSSLPDKINILGVNINLQDVIDKVEFKNILKNKINKDESIKILSKMLGYDFSGFVYDKYYIFIKK